ncbi:glucose-6-phosphate isomerase [Congregibacter litoralis]|uniref:Glucose-6-phosphate isomerase n=1 Tax=Congregibacter litoralis KT71 TaxID=314285 RepID=A4A7Y3_9GAMM|nr:glucose-6-phosphate isomerase [Congregibacter litoralis]EAQ97778.1 glucose-6-phosphate isomerase [Congregibacter litoralis KT71]
MSSEARVKESGEVIWDALRLEQEALADVPTLELFDVDAERARDFSLEAAGLYLDYSKNHVSRTAVDLLLKLADACDVPERIAAMFRGDRINATEDRAVLHTVLRDRSGRELLIDGEDVCAVATRERDRMLSFVDDIHNAKRVGATGKPLTTVVNIGIGGSDLGPVMIVEGLRPYWIAGRRSFFVSNVDGQHLGDTLVQLDPETTLFIVASKTFSTQETMTNAQSALDWFLAQGGSREGVRDHFVALSTNQEAVAAFGIAPENTFGFWDWVGGRYSLWSSIGLSIALQVGRSHFLELLGGAFAMDEHFRHAAPGDNMPVLLALIGIWNRNLEDIGVHAILPYDQHLHRLPAYLQQADMESNGKSACLNGHWSALKTGPVIFGEAGTNGQHAFYQLLHQGTDLVSCDFIAAVNSQGELGDHHPKLLANLLAQPRALMCGKSLDQVRRELVAQGMDAAAAEALAPHKVFEGDRPSNTILMERLTAESLGALVALYEHKIFVQGVIWGINSFDQWGVELGKQLASELLPLINGAVKPAPGGGESELDPSTAQLLDWIRRHRAVS